MENEFDDFIILRKRFNSHKVNSDNLSMSTKALNQRKVLISSKFNHLESIGFDFPFIIDNLYLNLLEKAEITKSFFEQWNAVNIESDRLFKQVELFEIRKLNTLEDEFSVFEIQQIEEMVINWNNILFNQESLIVKRYSALKDEEKIIDEIEKNLALI
jgi:hypothetical protein